MVYKKMLVFYTISCLIIGTKGCYRYRQVTQGSYVSRQITQDELDKHPELRIQRIIMVNNKIYEFPAGAFLEDNVIIGYTSDGEYVNIPRDQVKTIYVYRSDTAKFCTFCGSTAAVLGVCVLFGYIFFLFVTGGPK